MGFRNSGKRESGRLLVQVVEKRNASTLLPIIQKWISTDCLLVVSEEWKAYGKLKNLNYNHEKINHSKNFVDVNNSRIHTQTIENRWGQIKNLMRKTGKISRNNFSQKLKEITWRINNRENIQTKMLEIVTKNYNL